MPQQEPRRAAAGAGWQDAGVVGWVLFDYGAVLCTEQPAQDRRALVAAAGIDPADRLAVRRFWDGYWRDRGPYDRAELEPAAYWARVLERTPGTAEVAALDRADVAGWCHPQPASLAVAEALADDGVELALLSNAPASLADAVDRLRWMQVVPRRFYSCRLRATKPDPAAYGGVLAELGADPAEVTFVDDRPANVAGAAAVGMRALQFTDPARLAADLGVESR
ncbi:MAG: HAD-IA family hydrolase [Mycobacteriales bacterium]